VCAYYLATVVPLAPQFFHGTNTPQYIPRLLRPRRMPRSLQPPRFHCPNNNSCSTYFTKFLVMLLTSRFSSLNIFDENFVFKLSLFLKSFILWNVTSCSLSQLLFRGTCRFHPHCRSKKQSFSTFASCFLQIFFLTYYSTLKIEAVCSSETSVNFYRNTMRYFFRSHRCEGLTPNTRTFCSFLLCNVGSISPKHSAPSGCGWRRRSLDEG
jgi:hypothetical protein